MLLYFDTRGLIQVLERGHPLRIDELLDRLTVGRHEVVVSFANVRKLVQPLFEPGASTIVTRLLTQLERLPLRYVREAGIPKQELPEAFAALSEGREYPVVSPFVGRFDEVCTPLGQIPATANFLNLSAAETVFMIFRSDPAALRQPQRHLNALRLLLEAARKLSAAPSLKDHFSPRSLRETMSNGD